MDTKKDILDELKAESKFLYNIKEEVKDTFPSSTYFEDMQDKVMAQLKIDNYNNVNSNQGVPEKYFDTLSDRVIAQLKTPQKSPSIFKLYRSWMAVAASLALIVVAFTLMHQKETSHQGALVQNKDINVVTKDLSSEEIEYLLNRYSSDEDLQLLNVSDIHNAASAVEQVIDEEEFNEILSEEDLQYLNSIM